ncbi:t-SNARE coiled-coil domain-containing protein [Trichostrongylus colubriformis]|uniref:t-SNARE coiled-coil domain-containing protein n=2 Tax=Trichostrongylidae TaxID=6315 RepID=A0AAN8EPH9_TRICO
MASSSSTRYSRLKDNDDEEPGGSAFEKILMKQEQIIREQDEDLVLVGNSVTTLKNMSYKIGDELDQQAVMLDDLGQEMDTVDTKLDSVMKKIAKLTHMDDDKRQCKLIMILSVVIFFLLFLLIVL